MAGPTRSPTQSQSQSQSQSYEVIQLLVAMSARLSQHFAGCAAEFGLSSVEGKVLLALEPGQTRPMRALARQLGLDASNLTGVVDKLEDRGIVERRSDLSDRRIKVIATTEPGRALRDRFAQRLQTDDAPVRALSDAQLGELRQLLQIAMAPDRAG